MKDLNKLKLDVSQLEAREDANKEKIKAALAEYEKTLKTKEQWPRLAPQDGRLMPEQER